MNHTLLSARCRLRTRHGLTLVEVLAASLILIVSLIAMVSAWAQMYRTTLTTDQRGAAYQCARAVMERAHGVGFHARLPRVNCQSADDSGVNISAPILNWRYFDNNADETRWGSDIVPATDRTERFLVLTTVRYPDNNPQYPANRADLTLMTITVTVYDAQKYNLQAGPGPKNDPVVRLQTCLTEGGI